MGIIFIPCKSYGHPAQNSSKSYKDIAVEATLKYIDSWYRTANLRKSRRGF